MQIATLTGRETAVQVARRDANAHTPWTKEQVRKFKYIPGGPPDFTHDALHELLALGVGAHNRRIADAVNESESARLHSTSAEGESDARLDAAARAFHDPNAERLVRDAVRAYSLRAAKECHRLRSAAQKLEQEVTSAQATWSASMRNLGASLVAQRDAISASVLAELERAEVEGATSIRGLEGAMQRLRDEFAERDREKDVTIATLREQLQHAQTQVRSLIPRYQLEFRILAGVVCEEEAARHRALGECACLQAELSKEERSRVADALAARRKHTFRLAREAADKMATEAALSSRLEGLGVEKDVLQAENLSKAEKLEALDAAWLNRDKRVRREKDAEIHMLANKVELLEKKVEALRASKSTRRSRLYWSGMAAQAAEDGHERTYSVIDSIDLADPAQWRKPVLSEGFTPAVRLETTLRRGV